MCLRCDVQAEAGKAAALFGVLPRPYQEETQEKRGQSPIARSGDRGLSDAPSPLCDGPAMVWPERNFTQGPTPGALQGDDYQLEYYEDGYPKDSGVSRS